MKIWFITIRNEAALDEEGSPELSNITLPLSPSEGVDHIVKVVEGMPRWQVESRNRDAGSIHLTRRTRLWGFVDDIHLSLEPVENGSRLHGRSRGRIGLTDFGQNRRNLRELIRAIQ